MDYLAKISDYIEQEKTLFNKLDKSQISNVISVLEMARINSQRIFVMGNGGSAATASHFCCDFNKGISYNTKPKYKFICLNDNIPTMLAYANDFSFDDVFVHSLKNLFEPRDIIWGISTSGNSTNVIRALQWGKQNGAITIVLTGFDGGMCHTIADYEINVPSDNVQMIEDIHLVINHCIRTALCNQ